MASFSIQEGLPFVSVTMSYRGQSLTLTDVLLDTGSATTIFRIDVLKAVGINPQPTDKVRFMVGIGDGFESVLERRVDSLAIGTIVVAPYTIQMGFLNYPATMNGIVGADFLLAAGAVIDFSTYQISPLRS